LLRLAARLPNHGAYKASIADDDRFARLILARQPEAQPMTMLGYDGIAARLDTLIDVLVAANSTGTPPRMPRPVTAADRLAAASSRSRHLARVRAIRGDPTRP
jgi:hypothetical protein